MKLASAGEDCDLNWSGSLCEACRRKLECSNGYRAYTKLQVCIRGFSELS